MKNNLVAKLMNETILYGGLPLRRCDVYQDCLDVGVSHKWADVWAFGRRAVTVDMEPLTMTEFNEIVRNE